MEGENVTTRFRPATCGESIGGVTPQKDPPVLSTDEGGSLLPTQIDPHQPSREFGPGQYPVGSEHRECRGEGRTGNAGRNAGAGGHFLPTQIDPHPPSHEFCPGQYPSGI